MTTELKQLELDEVSLVDAGDDPLARVAIFKRKQEEDMDKEDVIKGLEADLEALKVEKTALETEVETLTKALSDAKAPIEKEVETVEIDGEKIVKSAIPAVILKKLEDVEKARVAEDLRKRANETIPNFKGTADERGKLMKVVGDDAELMAMLRAADALFGATYGEVGKSDASNDSMEPLDAFNAMVKSHDAVHKIGFYKAYEAVAKTAEGKALLNQSYKK